MKKWSVSAEICSVRSSYVPCYFSFVYIFQPPPSLPPTNAQFGVSWTLLYLQEQLTINQLKKKGNKTVSTLTTTSLMTLYHLNRQCTDFNFKSSTILMYTIIQLSVNMLLTGQSMLLFKFLLLFQFCLFVCLLSVSGWWWMFRALQRPTQSFIGVGCISAHAMSCNHC